MAAIRNQQVMVYLEGVLWALVQEGVLNHSELSASTYIRNLILTDCKTRGLLSEDVIDSLLTGRHLVTTASAS